eukprot:TRINITY_DN72858_c0_g1_i1.p1 TRINITY_DN72858_c0_g1~~TRINITY_DN72858_c0_g1_i1.p1  ORF type:complete len:165 (+),score=19.45 TRINITY_DN72858_c0_g1_i1:60-554(+)
MCPGAVLDVENVYRYTNCPKSCTEQATSGCCPLGSLTGTFRVRGTFLDATVPPEEVPMMRRSTSSPALSLDINQKRVISLDEEALLDPAFAQMTDPPAQPRRIGRQIEYELCSDELLLVGKSHPLTAGHRRRMRQRQNKKNSRTTTVTLALRQQLELAAQAIVA